MKKILMIIVVITAFAAAVCAAAPTIRVVTYPQTVVDAKTGTVNVTWDDGVGGVPVFTATFLYGISSGAYTGTIDETSAGTLSFIPVVEGLESGVYYFRVSNNADSTWSNEYRLFIGEVSGLDVKFIELSPNPFSPDLGGLNINYTVISDKSTSVKTTIKAYNMDGKFIRTIAAGEMKTVGTINTTNWDGRDSLGYPAKNGRYIIQIEVQDTTGKKQYLKTAVMVK